VSQARSRAHDLAAAAHSHAFADASSGQRERALGWVAVITVLTMVAELLAGWWSGSLALTADGWHMGTHAFAMGGAWFAYRLSARAGQGYAFGGWKIEVLAAYTSGLLLLAVAAWIVWDSVARLLHAEVVDYRMAMTVAVLGLLVNLACAAVLMRAQNAGGAQAGVEHADHDHGHAPHPSRSHDHGHGHGHGHSNGNGNGKGHGHGHGLAHGAHHGSHGDHNFSAAYLHVLADAFTSVLAILALAGGAYFGWVWLDAAAALLGAVVITRWAWGVLRVSAQALVDGTQDAVLALAIRKAIESDGDTQVADLHVWQVAGTAWTAALSVVAEAPRPAAEYRARLAHLPQLRHLTIEVHPCPGCELLPASA
jgi:cation diffusion facilitator family transporter